MNFDALNTRELAELTHATAEAMDARDTLRRLADRYPEDFGELRDEAERFTVLCVRRLSEETRRAEGHKRLRLVE